MCAMLKGVPAGNPVRLATKVTVPAVMLLAASRVTLKVIVAVPLPVASAPVIAGTSLAGLSAAVNVGFTGVFEGSLDDLPHAAAPTASMAATTARRFIVA